MTKDEMVAQIAKTAGINKRQAGDAINCFFDSVKTSLKKGNKVSFVGFGTFSVAKRKARQGHNPQTGEKIQIPATKVPHFKAGKGLKDAVKKK
ncbi:MAG: HU family DNA-binding protein [Candidatus Zixiibacteriota bacterium]